MKGVGEMMNNLLAGGMGLLLVFIPFTHGADLAGAKPAEINPATRQAAEDARFKWVDTRYRPALLAQDKVNSELIDAWGAVHRTRAEMATLELVWGTATRRDAVKRKERLATELLRIEKDFRQLLERQKTRADKDLILKRKNVETLAAWPSKSTDRLDAAKVEVTSCEDLVSALSALESSLTEYRGVQVADRLSQIGIPTDSGSLRKELPKYRSIVDTAFLIKDIKADLVVLVARQKEGTGWTRNDGAVMATLQSNLEREGKKLEQLIAQEQIVLVRDIEKLRGKVKKLNDDIAKQPARSRSGDRMMTKESELASELLDAETKASIFANIVKWKEPEAGVAGNEPKK
jgi:hypothetical protein